MKIDSEARAELILVKRILEVSLHSQVFQKHVQSAIKIIEEMCKQENQFNENQNRHTATRLG